MANSNFTTSFVVDKSPKEVFAAINDVRGWWGQGIGGGTEKLHDEFVYRHKEFHYSKHRLIELVPGKKVVWLTLDSQLSFVKHKDEWTGSKVVFEIAEHGDKTELRFTHEGLRPDNECYDACSNGWTHYIGSLKELITTGVGKPDPAAFALAS